MRGEEQLREELQEFHKEKERLRSIVGEIGGSGKTQNKMINSLLMAIIVILLVAGGALQKISLSLTLQLAILIGIFKLIWMFYESQRANHFQFWILNSLEFKINEISKRVRKIEKELDARDIEKNEAKGDQ